MRVGIFIYRIYLFFTIDFCLNSLILLLLCKPCNFHFLIVWTYPFRLEKYIYLQLYKLHFRINLKFPFLPFHHYFLNYKQPQINRSDLPNKICLFHNYRQSLCKNFFLCYQLNYNSVIILCNTISVYKTTRKKLSS